jgi:hypothetical protein
VCAASVGLCCFRTALKYVLVRRKLSERLIFVKAVVVVVVVVNHDVIAVIVVIIIIVLPDFLHNLTVGL